MSADHRRRRRRWWGRRQACVATIVLAACLALLALAPTAAASSATATATTATPRVAVIVVPRFDPAAYARKGAVGLLVPGAGATVSRERALASLVRGRVVSSLVGLGGTPEIALATRPGDTTIYVSLPPPGDHHNVVRYPVAVVGAGYRGLLTSASTRIPGLVSLADVAPTARALAAGTVAPIRWRTDAAAAATLTRLDQRLARAHDARTGATLVLVAWLVLFAAGGILGRWAISGRAAILTAPSALTVALALRAAGIDQPRAVVAVLGVATGAGALGLALRPGVMPWAVVAFLIGLLVVLVAWPDLNALAAIGPHPDGGGRFYGVTNQVETLLLAPSIAAAATLTAGAAAAVGLLLLVLVGWSRAGADGGGLVVVAAAWAVLLAGMTRVRLTPARVAVGIAAVGVAGIALVGLDALAGGSSHVTDAVGGGPGTLLDDLDRRLHISWAGATGATHTAFLCLLSLGGLAWLAIRGRRTASVPALVVGIAVSLIVNDTPVDVLGYGALGALALTAWEETRASRPVSARSAASHPPRGPREPVAH